jgi:predicted ATP-dependent endonuclease of OLD family
MSKNDIASYPEKLNQSEFYTSLVFIIKKYFNRTLTIEYVDNLLVFVLIDQFGQRATFAQLSDGEQSLLSMVFSMYGYDLNHGMIIVDEPEIHFHPQMQRSFSRMIEKINQNIGTQFILSTYSPLFINESNIGNVYRFSKINGETRIKNPFFVLSSDEATLVHLLKFENLSKIFFVNKIIMVEGETDAYFFDFYLRYLHTLPQRKDKITDYEILNINGK